MAGKPNAISSLSSNSAAVDVVTLDTEEEYVVGGLASGGLRVWDITQGKISRTFPGHISNVRCVDFSPFGEFIVSGSLDTNVKVSC